MDALRGLITEIPKFAHQLREVQSQQLITAVHAIQREQITHGSHSSLASFILNLLLFIGDM
jgi:hypothetical protein